MKIHVKGDTAPRGGVPRKTPSMLGGCYGDGFVVIQNKTITPSSIRAAWRGHSAARGAGPAGTAANSNKNNRRRQQRHAQNDRPDTTGEKKEGQKQEQQRRAEGHRETEADHTHPHTTQQTATANNSNNNKHNSQQQQQQTYNDNNCARRGTAVAHTAAARVGLVDPLHGRRARRGAEAPPALRHAADGGAPRVLRGATAASRGSNRGSSRGGRGAEGEAGPAANLHCKVSGCSSSGNWYTHSRAASANSRSSCHELGGPGGPRASQVPRRRAG